MSGRHTESRLVVGELNGHGIELKHTNGDVPGAISLVLARVTARPTWMAEAEANARRLAACWNACEGMTTEALEALPGPFNKLLSQEFLSLVDQLAAARALLAEVRDDSDEWSKEAGVDQVDTSEGLLNRIRAFLAGEDA